MFRITAVTIQICSLCFGILLVIPILVSGKVVGNRAVHRDALAKWTYACFEFSVVLSSATARFTTMLWQSGHMHASSSPSCSPRLRHSSCPPLTLYTGRILELQRKATSIDRTRLGGTSGNPRRAALDTLAKQHTQEVVAAVASKRKAT